MGAHVFALAFIPFSLVFAAFSGKVLHEGTPVAGAMVSWSEKKEGSPSLTVYSNRSGKFKFAQTLNGGFLKARHPSYADQVVPLNPNFEGAILMPSFESPEERAASYPASAHAVKVLDKLPKEQRLEMVGQCFMCHQIGNSLTRVPREKDHWKTIVDRMEGMGAMLTSEGRKNFPKVLSETYTGELLMKYQPDQKYYPEWEEASLREWPLARGTSHIHDVVVAKSGMIYGVDMSLDRIYRLNPETGDIKNWKFPESDLPMGGVFAGAYHPLGTFGAKFGPHSVIEGPEGLLWITASLAGEIMSFDPEKGKYERYPLPEGVYPHTMRFDKKGNLWFSISVTNQIAKLNLKTKEYKFVDLPSKDFFQWISAKLAKPVLWVASKFPEKNFHVFLSSHKSTGKGYNVLPLPYGIDIHPKDGSVWYSKLNGKAIGRIDPESFEVKEFETPLHGPRRLRFAKDGKLWIPAFMEGALMSFDTDSEKFEVKNIPALGQGQQETPYALAIHPQTQEVWVTGGTSDRMIRYNPKEDKFTPYPLPTRVTFMREVDFLEDGQVCSSYANLPGYAIEGGKPKIMCLKP